MNEATTQIAFMDGTSEVTSWPLKSGSQPTVGDRVDVAEGAKNTGYSNTGIVTKVEVDEHSGTYRIEVAAECPLASNERPVFSLNANMIPDRLRKEVETLLRTRIDFPVVEWLESYETTPIVQVHEHNTKMKTPVKILQTEIREILAQASELTVL
jgi:hypothetical protein